MLFFSRRLRHVRGEDVGELVRVIGLQRGQDSLCRQMVGQLGVFLEQLHQPRHVVGNALVDHRLDTERFDLGHHALVIFIEREDAGAAQALDHHFDVAGGQLQVLNHSSDDAEGVDVCRTRLIDLGVLLGGQENALVGSREGGFESNHRRAATDNERRHHMGIDHHVPQRDDR